MPAGQLGLAVAGSQKLERVLGFGFERGRASDREREVKKKKKKKRNRPKNVVEVGTTVGNRGASAAFHATGGSPLRR